MAKTIETLQAGSGTFKFVALIEGLPNYVLSDASQAAITTAFAGTDWSSATRVEAFFDITNSQTLTLWNPFVSMGSCRIRAHDQTDAFATFVAKRLSGAQTELTSTRDRDDTTFNVKSTTNFPASGTAYCGSETFTYSGVTATSFTGITRGIASPFGCDAAAGAGGARFANHHRLGSNNNLTPQAAPLVTQLPRVWVGRRVGVWMHTVATDGTLNSKADAQLVYAGRIASIADDPDTFHTVIDLEHIYETDLKSATLGRDMFAAVVPPGLQLMEGRIFEFSDAKFIAGAWTTFTANPLTVVSGTPASTNEIQVGWYSANELADRLTRWLGAELGAGRIYGHYSWQSPVSSNVGLRTKCYWKIDHGSNIIIKWDLKLPGEAAAFLGLVDKEGDQRGQQAQFTIVGKANTSRIAQGPAAPYESLVFYPRGPGRLAQEFGSAMTYALTDLRGQFYDQYDLLPYAVKGSCTSTEQWGIFLFDESVMIVGALDTSTPTAPLLKNCWVAPFTHSFGKSQESLTYVGRRLDDPEGGNCTVRQVLVLEQSWAQLFLRIMYSTGTTAYNHSAYDTLPYGCGLNFPGSLLGPELERSLLNLPGAEMPAVVVIDEATTFADLFRDDLIFRWSFFRWKDQGIEMGEWKTPVASMVAKAYDGTTSLAFVEANKAEPAGTDANHRIASIETNDHVRPVVRIDYARDFGSDRQAKYSKSVQIEDQRAVDDAGGGTKPTTIKLRHTFAELAATGSAVDKLLPGFVARMPLASRATRKIVRSIDMRYWEGYSVGDIALVTDNFARDPINGTRSIAARPAMITRLSYSPGGPVASGGKPRDMYGDVELMFLDLQRGKNYAPAAQVDETQANAGYNAGTLTLTCYARKYSHDISGMGLRRGGTASETEVVDASYFPAGSKILIVEIDPDVPGSPTMWERVVASQTGNTITLTVALSAPAWSSSLKYRIVPQLYSQVVAAQQDVAYMADDDDFMVQDLAPPWDFSQGGRGMSHNFVAGTEPGEYTPTIAAGDGRPYDVGHEHSLAFTLNALIDYKSAQQSPLMVNDSVAGLAETGSSEWDSLFIVPIYLGFEALSATITRYLTVAPWVSPNGGAGDRKLRISIGQGIPTEAVAVQATAATDAYKNATFTGPFSQSAEWTFAAAAADAQGDDAVLEVNCKDIHFGHVFLLIEGTNNIVCYGLAKCILGPRVY